jgi:hypothetical protein
MSLLDEPAATGGGGVMGDAGAGGAKRCAGCGVDVTNAKRVKDKRGRYVCTSCFQKYRAKKAAAAGGSAPAARSSGGDDDASDAGLIAHMMREQQRARERAIAEAGGQCDGCGEPLSPDARVCTACGFDRKAGKVIATRVLEPEQQRETKEKTSSRAPGVSGLQHFLHYTTIGSPMSFGLATLLLWVGPIALGTVVNPMLYALLLLSFVSWVVVVLVTMVFAFREAMVKGLLYLFLPFYAPAYQLVLCESEHLKAVNRMMWVGAAVFVVSLLAGVIDVSEAPGGDVLAEEDESAALVEPN